jgi:broad specificity phosphatase PhoE
MRRVDEVLRHNEDCSGGYTMCSIYVMRHALRPDGWSDLDCPISEEGKRQARNIQWSCDVAVVSNLCRTKQTLESSRVVVQEKIIETDLCREYMGGSRPDYTDTDLKQNGGKLKVETRQEFAERLQRFREFLADLATKHKSILVVSHGVFISALLSLQRGVYNCERFPYHAPH